MKKLFYYFSLIFIIILSSWLSIRLFSKNDPSFKPVQPSASLSPLRFIENKGQWDERILYKAKIKGGEILFEADKITWHFYHLPKEKHGPHGSGHEEEKVLKGHIARTHFEGKSPQVMLNASIPSKAYHNYFIGNDPSNWASQVSLFAQITYQDLYPGIDLRIYGYGDALKYDFLVEAGADPDLISLRMEGVDKVKLEGGRLKWTTSLREIEEDAPVSYQVLGEEVLPVNSRFRLRRNRLGFDFPEGYDPQKDLVIDPNLVFSTYSGSTSDNWGFTATYDELGNSYAGGIEITVGNFNQGGYPVTTGAYQFFNAGGDREITISKFNPDGTQLIYATYIGGNNQEQPHSLITNAKGELIIFGRTNSSNYPTTSDAYDSTPNGNFDMFITKLSANGGALIGSTYLGGSMDDGANGAINEFNLFPSPTQYNYADDARGEVFLDNDGNILVGGPSQSSDFPISAGAYASPFGGRQMGILAKFNANLSGLFWSARVGGRGMDAIYSVKVDESNNVLFAGGSSSDNLPASGLNTFYQGGRSDGFIGKLSSNGQSLLGLTYLGTSSYDQVYLMDTDKEGFVYVCGQTEGDFPVMSQPGVPIYSNDRAKQFVAKLSPQLDQIEYSTTVGSSGANFPNISPTAMLVDICENVYVTGWGGLANPVGSTANMPTTSDALQRSTDGSDIYIFVLSRDARELRYASYLGGNGTGNNTTGEHTDGGTSRFDKNGIVYHAVCAQCGQSAEFPTTAGAYSTANGFPDNCNLAVFKLAFDLEGVRADFFVESPGDTIEGCAPFTAKFNNASYLGPNPGPDLGFVWDFDVNGNKSEEFEPVFTFEDPGFYKIMLIVRDPLSCNLADTTYRILKVKAPPQADAGPDFSLCRGAEGQLQGSGGAEYRWSPAQGLSDPNIANPSVVIEASTAYTLRVIDKEGCEAEDQVSINVLEPEEIQVVETKRTCVDVPVLIQAWSNTGNVVSYSWSPSEGLSDPNIGSPIAMPEQTTDYVVTALDNKGCEISDTVRVEVEPRPQTQLDGINKSCSGGLIELMASGGDFFVWSTGDSASVITIPVPTEPETYIATAFIGNCEGISDTIVVDEKFDFPEASFAHNPETGFAPADIFFENTTVGGDTFLWDFGNAGRRSTEMSPTFTYPFAGEYRVELIASTDFGCTDTFYRTIIIEDTRIHVPSAFSPNGDGINDDFFVTQNGIELINIKIFSRWGAKVFEESQPDFTWDGKFNGKDLPEGVYVWVVEAVGFNGRKFPMKGTLTLIR